MYRERLGTHRGTVPLEPVRNRTYSNGGCATTALPGRPRKEKYADDQNGDKQQVQGDGTEQYTVKRRMQQFFALPDPLMKDHTDSLRLYFNG
jgi:hypothetical protein